MPNKKSPEKKMIKIIYFDETSASDYITIQNGGQIDWNTKENKEKLVKLLAEADAQAKSGVNWLSVIKASISGNVNTSFDSKTSNLFESTLPNTLLTDYIKAANKDKNIRQFHDASVYAPKNSVTIYKMYSSYLNIVPKEEIPIDLEQLNQAVLGERGYYQMIVNEKNTKSVLRFNISAFKNNYSLADLAKMNLSYFGVQVGTCSEEQLSMEKEFEMEESIKKPKASEIVMGDNAAPVRNVLNVYDIVLAGVMGE